MSLPNAFKSNMLISISTAAIFLGRYAFQETAHSRDIAGSPNVDNLLRVAAMGDSSAGDPSGFISLENWTNSYFVQRVWSGKGFFKWHQWYQTLKFKYIQLPITSGCGGARGLLEETSPCMDRKYLYRSMLALERIVYELNNPICVAELCYGKKVKLPDLEGALEMIGVGGSLPLHFLSSIMFRNKLNLSERRPILMFVVGPNPMRLNNKIDSLSLALEAALLRFIQNEFYDKGTRVILIDEAYRGSVEDHAQSDFINALNVRSPPNRDIADVTSSISRDEAGVVYGAFLNTVTGDQEYRRVILGTDVRCRPLNLMSFVEWTNHLMQRLEKDEGLKDRGVVAVSFSGPFHRGEGDRNVKEAILKDVNKAVHNSFRDAKVYTLITDHEGYLRTNDCNGAFFTTIATRISIDEIWSIAKANAGEGIVNAMFDKVVKACEEAEKQAGYGCS